MINNNRLRHAVLIYQQTKKPFKHRVVYAFETDYEIKIGEKHIASLDPAMWIECILNSKNKIKIIEKLYI